MSQGNHDRRDKSMENDASVGGGGAIKVPRDLRVEMPACRRPGRASAEK